MLAIDHFKYAVFAVGMTAFSYIRIFECVETDCTVSIFTDDVFYINFDCFFKFARLLLKYVYRLLDHVHAYFYNSKLLTLKIMQI